MVGTELVTSLFSSTVPWGPLMLIAVGVTWKVLPRLVDRIPDIITAYTAHKVAMNEAYLKRVAVLPSTQQDCQGTVIRLDSNSRTQASALARPEERHS